MSEARIVYITKYWQTRGILMVRYAEPASMPGGIRVYMSTEYYSRNRTASFFGSDWHDTQEEAIAHVENHREKQIKVLGEQLEKLRNLVVADAIVDCMGTDTETENQP